MRRFFELIKECNIDNIKYYIKKIFNLDDDKLIIYLNWYNNIINTIPIIKDNILFSRKDDWYDVFFIESINPNDVDKLTHYGVSDLLFPTLFGMYTCNDTNMILEEYVISIIYENTFHGFTDKAKLKYFKKISNVLF